MVIMEVLHKVDEVLDPKHRFQLRVLHDLLVRQTEAINNSHRVFVLQGG